MNQDWHLKLQSYFDGELPEAEAREVAALVARDAGASALLAELRHTRSALAGFEADLLKLPESREFHWSKIEREIQRLEKPEPVRPRASLWAEWRRVLLRAGAAATLILLAIVVGIQFGSRRLSRAPELQTAMTDSGAFTYRDYEAGVTLVWLSYPAENELAQTDGAGTLQ